MFDRFTDRARRVMGLARQEAQRLNHQYISTEHLLLGLVQEGEGVAASVLRSFDVSTGKIQRVIESLVQSGPTMVTMGQLPLTPRGKRSLEFASEEATNLRHNFIGTEHLLLGLLREHEGIAAQVLRTLGLSLDAVRSEVLTLLGADIETPVEEEVLPDKEAAALLFDSYQEFTRTTAVYPKTVTGDPLALAYCALGLAEEAGEVCGKLKKRIRLGGFEALAPGTVIIKEKDGVVTRETHADFVGSVKKELGDALWYTARAADEFGLSLSDVVEANIEKLTGRRARGTLKGEGDDR